MNDVRMSQCGNDSIAELELMRSELEQEYQAVHGLSGQLLPLSPEDRAESRAFYDRRLTAIAKALDALREAGR